MRVARVYWVSVVLGIFAILVWFLYWKLLLPPFLTFSDSAKFADIARNLLLGKGYGASFAFFSPQEIQEYLPGKIFHSWAQPLFPATIASSFVLFGVSDFAAILTSCFFYLAGAITLYFLGKKIFGQLVGILASFAFIFDPTMLDYATSGASESLFIFEIILAALLFYHNTKVSQAFGFLTMVALYFTRPQAFIYIAGFYIFFILIKLKKPKHITFAIFLTALVGFFFERILAGFAGKYFIFSPFRSVSSLVFGTALRPATSALRTETLFPLNTILTNFKSFFTKTFYDLYNFYKLLPQILSPYLAGFYLMSLFRWEKGRKKKIFRLIIFILVMAVFLSTALTIPSFRYLHPVIPFIYLLAIEMLVWVVSKMVTKFRLTVGKKALTINHQSLVIIVSLFLVFTFIIGQTAGKIFLDSRFLRAHTNPNKPPVYVQLAWILKENTKPNDLIITNLDTWGSWYGERKTIWFPLEPKQLIPEEGQEFKVDAIYLTSYKMDDENYYMGGEWREVFFHPEELKNSFFAENFELAGKFEIRPEETYEREGGKAILLIRKQ